MKKKLILTVLVVVLIACFYAFTSNFLTKPSVVFSKNIDILNNPSQLLDTFESAVFSTGYKRVDVFKLSSSNQEKTNIIEKESNEYRFFWDKQNNDFVYFFPELKLQTHDPTNFGIFSNAALWDKIVKNKQYSFRKDDPAQELIYVIPQTALLEFITKELEREINEAVKFFNDSDSSCYANIIENIEISEIIANDRLTGDMVITIDYETKLLSSIEYPNVTSYEAFFTGNSCDDKSEMIKGSYTVTRKGNTIFNIDQIAIQ